MTTVACDGKSLAADGMVTGSDAVHMLSFPKARRLPDGSVFAWSGQPNDGDAWERFLSGTDAEIRASDGSEAIRLFLGGEIICYNEIGRGYKQSAPCATGSGVKFALAAMLAGAPSKRAVEIACELDVYSGGTIIELVPELPQA